MKNGATPFEGFDFDGFWDDCDYAEKAYVSEPPDDELIAEIEAELGYKLPESYIWLMKRHNGGIPRAVCFPTGGPTSWAEDHVAISGIFGIGREKNYSLCGGLGSRFMIEEWEYPDIGVAVCDCPSAGHDMIFLDYRASGPQGEPKVVHVDQESDYKITPLADNFEDFIRGLVNGDEFEECEEDEEDDENNHRRVAEAILALPEEERTDELLGRLAVAYNNMEEYDKAIQVLEQLRPRQDNTPKFHYRLGYALYYSDRYPEARRAFTRALVLNPPEEIAEDCREFLEWIVEEYEQTEDYLRQKEESAGGETEQYTSEEMEAVENHIEEYFGEFENIWHELISPDIHVDICVIPPAGERDYYTLATMGMGAHRMNVPRDLSEYQLERAELVICVPGDWKLGENGEQWYWPVRLLKQLARLPGECDTWLGWGHTVDNQEPYADNTKLSSAILISPQAAADGAETVLLPNEEPVQFYQIIPLYQEEMEYKMANNAEALLERMEGVSFVVDPARPNVCAEGER